MRRRMQWSSTSPILIISLLLIPIIAIANGFNSAENKNGEEETKNNTMSFELVHRHDVRLAKGPIDQVEAIKGFLWRDYVRRQRMKQRLGMIGTNRTSHRRMNWETFEMPMHSGRDYGLGEYFVQVEVGTPGQKLWLAADTGSELTWFNCEDKNTSHTKRHGGGGGAPHKHKHHHHHHKTKKRSRSPSSSRTNKKSRTKRTRANPNPCDGVFCPTRSSSFETVPCSSDKCKVELSDQFSLSYCPTPSDPCQYDISYVDGSSAKGYFGTDTITVDVTNGSKGKIRNLTIGCTKSIHNGVTFNEDTGGILGLGFSKGSFVDKALIRYGGKFSYCLVDHLSHQNVSSYLTFGTQNVKLLAEMKKTELLLAPPFYGVNVVGISIGGQMLKIPPQVWDFNSDGGVIIDSGTTLTSLVIPVYEQVFDALNKSLANVKMASENFGVLEFCFDSEGFNESAVARLAIHFAGGVKFEPPVKNYIIDVQPQVKCIGIVPIAGTGANVIGNIMQQNHLWEFNLAQYTVGFAPSACT